MRLVDDTLMTGSDNGSSTTVYSIRRTYQEPGLIIWAAILGNALLWSWWLKKHSYKTLSELARESFWWPALDTHIRGR